LKRFVLLLKVLFAVSLPLLLLATSLRLAINAPALYQYGFHKYGVSAESGISDRDLDRIATGLVDYFNSDEDLFRLVITRYGQQVPLFHENESVHFRDVKDLVQLDYRVQWITLAYVVLFVVGMLLWKGQNGWTEVIRATRWGSGVTLAIMALLGIAVALGFEQLFLAFHLAFFSNDLWMAFSGDVMNVLFPEMFFRDALVIVAAAIVIGAGLLLALSWNGLRRRRPSAKTRSSNS